MTYVNFKNINLKLAIIGELHYLGIYSKEAQLNKLTKVVFDGGYHSYLYLMNNWNGEDNQLDIPCLEGIEKLTNLEIFNPISMIIRGGVDYSSTV